MVWMDVDCENLDSVRCGLLTASLRVLSSAPAFAAFEDVRNTLSQVAEDTCSLSFPHVLELSPTASASLLGRLRGGTGGFTRSDLRGLGRRVSLVRSASNSASVFCCYGIHEVVGGFRALTLLVVLAQLLFLSTGSNTPELCNRLTLGQIFVAELFPRSVDLLWCATSLRCTLHWAFWGPWSPSLPLDLLAR